MKIADYMLIFALILAGCSQGRPATRADLETRLDQWGQQPGIQYVVFTQTDTLYARSAGFADLVQQIHMQRDTRQAAYSMSKTFTAILILQLVDEGLIQLDTPLVQYLPWVKYPKTLHIRHLLAQSSGIANPLPLRWASAPEQEIDSHQMLKQILAQYPDLDFQPGEKYAYSNLSYWLLEEVAEAVTGQDFAQLMQGRLFAKANLKPKQISFSYAGDAVAEGYLSNSFFLNLTAPWLIDESLIGQKEQGWLNMKPHLLYSKGMGGIIASAESLAQMMQAILKENSPIFSTQAKAALFQPQRDNQGQPLGMSLGWHLKLGPDGLVAYYFKEGGGPGGHSEMRYYPAAKVGSIVISNHFRFAVKSFLNQYDPIFTKSPHEDL